MNTMYCVEHSQNSEDHQRFSLHVGTLAKALESNIRDFHQNNRKDNKWQILFVGEREQCYAIVEEFEEIVRDRNSDQYPPDEVDDLTREQWAQVGGGR
jgi:hypothetical protein